MARYLIVCCWLLVDYVSPCHECVTSQLVVDEHYEAEGGLHKLFLSCMLTSWHKFSSRQSLCSWADGRSCLNVFCFELLVWDIIEISDWLLCSSHGTNLLQDAQQVFRRFWLLVCSPDSERLVSEAHSNNWFHTGCGHFLPGKAVQPATCLHCSQEGQAVSSRPWLCSRLVTMSPISAFDASLTSSKLWKLGFIGKHVSHATHSDSWDTLVSVPWWPWPSPWLFTMLVAHCLNVQNCTLPEALAKGCRMPWTGFVQMSHAWSESHSTKYFV